MEKIYGKVQYYPLGLKAAEEYIGSGEGKLHPDENAINAALTHILSFVEWLAYQDRKNLVSALLLELGMSAKSDGFEYLLYAIPSYMKDHEQSATKEIYPDAAKSVRGNGSSDQVEKAIRSAIKATWKTNNSEVRAIYFPPEIYGTTEAPSNMRFIARIARLLELWETAVEK